MEKKLRNYKNFKKKSILFGWPSLIPLLTALLMMPSLSANTKVIKLVDGLKAIAAQEEVEGGSLNEDDFYFCVDGEADHVSGISVEGASGPNGQWVVTSPEGDILGLPPAPEAVNFDEAGPGVCLIWYLSYADGLEGLMAGNNVDDLVGIFDLSDDYVTVTRSQPMGGELTGGPFEFNVDGTPDMVSGIGLSGNSGSNSQWVITDEEGNILGLPPTPEVVDFDGAGPGVCLIWNLSYEDGLIGLEGGKNVNGLMGCYSLSSNYIKVTRIQPEKVDGGTLNEDDFYFCVDGEADHVEKVSVEGSCGPNGQWVVTDEEGNILGLPPSPEAVNFDEAGPGVCLIWYLSYADGLEGLMGGNNVSDLVGVYDLSDDYVTVTRSKPYAGEIVGGPFAFDVDGTPDMVSGLSLVGERSGTNSTWVITDDQGKILGLPPTLEAVEGVNFDGAGPGTCLIWYLRYEDGLQGLAADLNANDLMGCFDLSNYVEVVRTETAMVDGGTLNEDDFYFCVDGEADHVSGISAEDAVGPNMQWVVTDEEGNILGLPPSPEAVNFDEAGPGVCLIWNLAYADGLEGLMGGNNVSDLVGVYDLSDDYVTVTRSKPEAGEIIGGPFAFDVDGTPDMVSGLSLEGERSGTKSTWVITDDQGKILGLPPTLEAVEGVNFDGAGPGTCLIWYLRYEDGLQGAEMGLNANDLMGCFDLSNYVEVVRTEAAMVDGGTLNEDDFYFCVDGEADHVSGISAEDAVGPNMQWVVTDEDGNILGLPPSPEAVNFDEAGPGVCLIWNLAYADGLEGLMGGSNVSDLVGTYDLSDDYVTVTRSKPYAGEIIGGPFAFDVDGTPDMVSGLSLEGERSGTNSTWVITDDQGKILGLPPTLEALEGVNFDGAGPGTCLIWYLRYEDGLQGLAADLNANDLMGCFDLSNYVEVVRTETAMVDGGTLNEDDFYFCVDGEADHVSGISAEGSKGPNMQWVVTDEEGNILGLPPSPEAVNFDEAGPGVCLIWNLAYADGLEGLMGGNNVSDLVGTYDLSDDYVTVTRSQPEGGELTGGPFEFIVGDEEADNVSGVEVTGNSGANSQWVITDEDGKILGLPPSPDVVNFDGAGEGTCLIWHLSYADGLEGLEAENNVSDLVGCYSFSDSITVERIAASSSKSATVSLYPNPTVDKINISLGTIDINRVKVGLFDFGGNDITSKLRRTNEEGLSFDVQSLPSGIYLLRLYNGGSNVITKKVVIQ